MSDNATATAQTCFHQLRKIQHIRKFLSLPALKSITQSLVISRLDYCNALYAGAPDYIIKGLQHIQNMAARVITWGGRTDDAKLIRHQLHWLPVKERVQFKVLFLKYKSLNDLAPDYIHDLLTVYNPRWSLQSKAHSRLVVPKYTNSYGKRFPYAAPVSWNSLPENIKRTNSFDSFKNLLKHILIYHANVHMV